MSRRFANVREMFEQNLAGGTDVGAIGLPGRSVNVGQRSGSSGRMKVRS
jgi:hypothetical protein